MRRVAVMGGSCTGKTTVSRRLAAVLGVPHVELDALHHDPGWQEASAEVFQARVSAALDAAPEGWVVDGNYRSKLGDRVLELADTAVLLEPPFFRTLGRAFSRTARRTISREVLWNGNTERFRHVFRSDWIPLWVIRTHRHYERQNSERVAVHPHLTTVRLRSDAEVEAFAQSIQAIDAMSGSSNGSERQKTPPFVET